MVAPQRMQRMKDGGAVQLRRLAAYAYQLLLTWRRWRPIVRAIALALVQLLAFVFKVLLALLIIFEEWGWRTLADLLGRLGRWRPWASVEAWITRLPPYAALVVFALPTLLLLPLKFLALLLIAGNHVVAASLLFVAAKFFATALIARLFLLTQPALMQIGWFATAYHSLLPWRDALLFYVHNSWLWRGGRRCKAFVVQHFAAQWTRLRPIARELALRARKLLFDLSLRGRDHFGAARRWLGRAISR
jgi:hypothetical protein